MEALGAGADEHRRLDVPGLRQHARRRVGSGRPSSACWARCAARPRRGFIEGVRAWGPRKVMVAVAAMVGLAVGFGLVGLIAGRSARPQIAAPPPVAPPIAKLAPPPRGAGAPGGGRAGARRGAAPAEEEADTEAKADPDEATDTGDDKDVAAKRGGDGAAKAKLARTRLLGSPRARTRSSSPRGSACCGPSASPRPGRSSRS